MPLGDLLGHQGMVCNQSILIHPLWQTSFRSNISLLPFLKQQKTTLFQLHHVHVAHC